MDNMRTFRQKAFKVKAATILMYIAKAIKYVSLVVAIMALSTAACAIDSTGEALKIVRIIALVGVVSAVTCFIVSRISSSAEEYVGRAKRSLRLYKRLAYGTSYGTSRKRRSA